MYSNKLNRRLFLSKTVKVGVGLAFIPSILRANNHKNFAEPNLKQQPLPYSFNALEPFIDATTMEIHYTKHAAGYAKNLSDALKDEYKKHGNATLKRVLTEITDYSTKMRNNAGGHYNHELFWQCLTPNSTKKPGGKLSEAIDKNFGSFDAFNTQFADAAKNRFGSGWAWLIGDKKGNLRVTSTPNQDNPLMNNAEQAGYPLLALDVWEHAYYLQYQNKRADYIANFWNIVNWNYVEARFADYSRIAKY